ncbi:MAG: serine/threonine-protein kinase [Bacteroidota bacterium]|nr:serine/threonine-protein kinase [Bacteroidota bacterium]MDP4257425.1 serine/threonine-protein kinase [Bacteroidota bacterium]
MGEFLNRIKTLGRGGLGVVSLYQTTEGQVAVKQMLNSWDSTLRERFHREIQIMASLVHKNIVKILNYNISQAEPWYTMKYYKDGSLRDQIKKLAELGKIYNQSAAASIIYFLADAMSHAHANNIIHRDLKPENILFENEEPKIADWGIGRFIHHQSKVLTNEGIGTKIYCAPEQWQSGNADQRSDIYSLGIIFRELLTGLTHGTISDPILNNIVTKMTALSPDDRYQSMYEVMQAIQTLEIVNTENPMQAFWEGAAKVAITAGLAWLLINALSD